jgi:tetratricopeptide (TPR) repeat protein
MRKAGALEEAFHLLEKASHELKKLCEEEPTGGYHFESLACSMYEIGTIHWKQGRTEETLAAGRRAVEAQRRSFAIAPTRQSREELGKYHLRLGRKLCELGHIDEAESCFRESQALWPGDTTKHEEAMRELRKWAAQVGDGKADLPPEQQQERQRYLGLCDRLKRNGPAGVPAPGDPRPQQSP